MAQIDFFCDGDRWVRVAGRDNSSIVDIPRVCQNDTLSLRIWPPTVRAGGLAANPPYDYVIVAGTTLRVVVGDPGDPSYLTQQFSWAESTDTAYPNYFFADLPFNTNAIDTALG